MTPFPAKFFEHRALRLKRVGRHLVEGLPDGLESLLKRPTFLPNFRGCKVKWPFKYEPLLVLF